MNPRRLRFDSNDPVLPEAEKRAARLILVLFLAAICLPYAFAALITPPNQVWGGLLLSADDQNVHLMWARQAQDGAFFMRDLFTTEPLVSGERALFFNCLPYLMGVLSRVTGLDVVVWYHVIRVAAAALGLWQFHELARVVTRDEAKYSRARILALVLLSFTLGGGFLGTLWPPIAHFFIDRPIGTLPIMPEAFYALSALISPINTASMALLALIFRLVLEKRGALTLFFAALLLSNIHTYDALPLIVAVAIWMLWTARDGDRASLKIGAATITGALLPVVYQFIVFRGSEEFRAKALTVTAPPPPLYLLLSFAPLLVCIAWSRPASRELPAPRLLWIWIASVFALIYVPTSIFPFARKMMEGVQLPLCLLASLGLSAFISRFASRPARMAVAGAVVLLPLLSTLELWAWIGQNAVENNASRVKFFMPPLSISRGEAGALRVLDAREEQGAVLCLPFLGSYVPRASAKVTYLGHWAETLHHDAKLGEVSRFYRGQMSAPQAREFLVANRIRWVIYGPFERGAFGQDKPNPALNLQPIYQGGDAQSGLTTLYQVP